MDNNSQIVKPDNEQYDITYQKALRAAKIGGEGKLENSSTAEIQITKSAYILAWMSGYWITGVIPLYATALLPMFAGPIMGLQTSGTLSREYLPTSNFLFISSMFLAGAAEHCNLHRRIVMLCLKYMGGDPRL
ncbi:hypothetical protein ACTXT7_015693 [Hymenolepis weldensis]